MQTQSSGRWMLPVAIVLGAVMICATLIALNARTIYPLTDQHAQTEYLRLIQSGCTDVTVVGGGLAAVSCPVWVRL